MQTIDEKKVEAWIDQVAEENPEALTMDGHDNAIVGIARTACGGPLLAYSETRIIVNLIIRDKMEPDEAREFFEFNIACAYMGPGTPVIIDD